MLETKLNYIYIPSTKEVIYIYPPALNGKKEMSMEEYLHKKVKIPLKKGFYLEYLHLIKLLEIKNKKLHIVVEGKDTHLLDRTMMEVVTLFPGNHFCQTHESYLANINYFKKYIGAEEGILLEGNIKVPVSRAHKDSVKNAIDAIAILIPARVKKPKRPKF